MTHQARKTPLHDAHVDFAARMIDFAGWSMPVQFAGVKEEHLHTRNACSLFDVSHMGRLKLAGNDAAAVLDHLCTRNLSQAEPGRSYYTHICREDGGVLDDVIVSRFDDNWGVVCNAVNRPKITAWIRDHATQSDVSLTDETESTAMIALQGPKTVDVAASLVGDDITSIKRYALRVFEFMGMSITVYRSGYTGEDGFEVVLPAGLVSLLLPKVLGTPQKPHFVVRPAGLAARDTLRIEAGMPLYGHELSEDWDSLTARQGWCVDLTKDFIGAEQIRQLKQSGLARKLVGLRLEGNRIARQHAEVFSGDKTVGLVTSGTLSPTLGTSIAMALVTSEHTSVGTTLEVVVGSKRAAAEVVDLPFYRRT